MQAQDVSDLHCRDCTALRLAWVGSMQRQEKCRWCTRLGSPLCHSRQPLGPCRGLQQRCSMAQECKVRWHVRKLTLHISQRLPNT